MGKVTQPLWAWEKGAHFEQQTEPASPVLLLAGFLLSVCCLQAVLPEVSALILSCISERCNVSGSKCCDKLSKPYILWLCFISNFFPYTPIIITSAPSAGFLTYNPSLFLFSPSNALFSLFKYSLSSSSFRSLRYHNFAFFHVVLFSQLGAKIAQSEHLKNPL